MENTMIQPENIVNDSAVEAAQASGNPMVGLLIGFGITAAAIATAYIGKAVYKKVRNSKKGLRLVQTDETPVDDESVEEDNTQ